MRLYANVSKFLKIRSYNFFGTYFDFFLGNFSNSNNKIYAGPSKQVTLTRNNFHAGKPVNRGNVQHFRPMANINVSNTVC